MSKQRVRKLFPIPLLLASQGCIVAPRVVAIVEARDAS
jgi:hypothetical protein